jgi:hypothetical protein
MPGYREIAYKPLSAAAVRSFLLVLLFVFGTSNAAQAQIVRGQVVDSISEMPISGGVIVLVDSAGSEVGRTTTDDRGLFLIRVTEAGSYRLRAEGEGYRASEFPQFELAAEQMLTYMLLVTPLDPSQSYNDADPETIIARVCPAGTPIDQPVIIGAVTDAATGEPVTDAEVRLSWPTVPGFLSDHLNPEFAEGSALTGSTGFYAVCGAPLAARISMHAVSGSRMSAITALTFESGGAFTGAVFNLMPSRIWRQDFELRSRAEWTGVVSGNVTNIVGNGLAEAIVSIVGTQFMTRTGLRGDFELRGMPPGDMRLSVERIGYSAAFTDLELFEGEELQLADSLLQMQEVATELAPVEVTAEGRATRRSFADFERRRETSPGTFITEEEWEERGSVDETTDVLSRIQGIHMRRGFEGLEWVITTRRGRPRSGREGDNCYPLVFVDRMYIGSTGTVNVNSDLPIQTLHAIEVHASAAGVPPEFNRPGAVCGVIAFWTK